MDASARHGRRSVEVTEAAAYDLAGIDNATAATWGVVQAERYIAFLYETLAHLAEEPALGHSVESREGCLVFTARSSKRRSAYGHRIFYRETMHGIMVLRILHTAMNWPGHLGLIP